MESLLCLVRTSEARFFFFIVFKNAQNGEEENEEILGGRVGRRTDTFYIGKCNETSVQSLKRYNNVILLKRRKSRPGKSWF